MAWSDLANALAWKYGFIANTKEGADGKMVITSWRHATIPEPDEAQLLIDIDEYLAYKAAKDAQEATDAAQWLQDIADTLPSRQAASDAIDAAFPNSAQRKIVKGMAKILYGLVKGIGS